MVPLTQNPLLKLPGASSRLERLAVLSPYQVLVAIGVGFTVVTGAFIGTEQWLSMSLTESIHQVGQVYTPSITAGLKAKSKIAQLLAEKSESFQSGFSSLDDRQIIETQMQEIAPILIEAAEGPNTPDERTSLSTDLKAFLNIESRLAAIDAEGSGKTVSEEANFSDLMDGDIRSFLDTSDILNLQRERDLMTVENESAVFNASNAFYVVFYLGEALLVVTSFLMVLWFRRIVNPGVAAALVVMVCGGGLLQSHLAASVASLQKMEQVFLSIHNLGQLQVHAAEADLYLHSWLISQNAEEWQKFYDKTYQIYNSDPSGSYSSAKLYWTQGNGLGSEIESTPPSVTLKESSFPVTKLQTMPPISGTEILGSGLLSDEGNQLQTIDPNNPLRDAYISILDSYTALMNKLELLRSNELQRIANEPVLPKGLDDSFRDLDQKITALQTKESVNFEIERIKAEANLQNTTVILLLTALVQVVVFWFGLISRLREYMRF